MKKATKFKPDFGFTLIELLIVISVIAILSIVGMVVYQGATTRSRDAKRKADLDAMYKAVEMFYGVNGNFPGWGSCAIDGTTQWNGTPVAWLNWSTCSNGDWDRAGGDIASLLENNSFIQKMPKDPINNATYNYVYEAWPDGPNATYYLCIQLEAGSGSIQRYNHNYCVVGGCTTCH